MSSTERDKIFERIREALKVPAPRPEPGKRTASNGPPASHAREWLPRTGTTLPEHLEQFTRAASGLKAEVILVKDAAELSMALKQLSDRESWKRIATHAGELTDPASNALGIPALRTDNGYDVRELEKCDVGITECDALVAQTGSVLVTARSAGGRGLSVLPPHHVVLARAEQLVADLPEAFAVLKRKYDSDYPSFISFITGPSRTGDIERILVLGAHGPKRLTILIVAAT